MIQNRSQGNKNKEVAYSDAEMESRSENEAIEFTAKELQFLDQGKIKRGLERGSRNEGPAKQEDVDFKIGQTVEMDDKPSIIPRRDRNMKIIQVEDCSDYLEREKLQALEKVHKKNCAK